jgi:site-specific recombinase XerD
MANLRAIIVPAKVLKGGKHKIRIAVSHNTKTRYIVTNIIIDSDREFKDGQIVKRPDASIKNVKLRGLLDKYQEALDNLDYIENLSCEELVAQLKGCDKYQHRTISSIYEEYVSVKNIKASTRVIYDVTINSIIKYLGKDMLMENVSYSSVIGLEKYLTEQGNSSTTIRGRQLFLMTLYFFAQKCMYIPFKSDPWFGYKLPEAKVRDAWLTTEEVAKIRDASFKQRVRRQTRDMFMLSYYLGGINMTDLLSINFNECGKHIIYERSKTQRLAKVNKYVEFDMPDEAIEIIGRYKQPNGFLFPASPQRKNRFHQTLDYNMKRIADDLGLNNLIFYSARKSFAQHALDLGIEQCTIDFILGHKLNTRGTSLFNYIRVTPEIATEAVQKVCTNLRNVVPLQTDR